MSDHSRRLAAVMFTDISGYTALMGRSERKALELIHINREIHLELIKKFEGTWVKEMGDGMLAQFHSAYNAVQCAIAIQQRARQLFKEKLRIGIHTGEIILEDGDIFGDGVNIAARIESITEPGGIYISETVYQSIQNNTTLKTRFLAEVHLKNVDFSIKVYCIEAEGIAVPNEQKIRQLKRIAQPLRAKVSRLSRHPVVFILLLAIIIGLVFIFRGSWIAPERAVHSVAVLPFTNLTGSDGEQYFVDMMHDAVITEISGIKNLIVKSRTSTLKFRNTTYTIPEIAKMLNVDAIVESAVYKTGDSVYLNVQLIKTRPVEMHLWAEDYKRDTRNIFSLYGELAKNVAKDVEVSLSPAEEKILTNKKEVDPEAYRAYLRGQFHWNKLSASGMDSAEFFFNKSANIDPEYALAYSGLASVALVRAQFGIIPFHEAALENQKYLDKAADLDSSSAKVHFLLAGFNTWGLWDFNKAEKEFLRTIELNPSDSYAHIYYSQLLCILNRYEEALEHAERADLLDPYNPLVKIVFAQNLNFMRKPERAIALLEDIRKTDPYNGFMLSTLRTSYHITRQYDKAIEAWKDSYHNDSVIATVIADAYVKGGYAAALNQLGNSTVKLSETQYVTPWRIATIFTRAGNKSQAVEWLEKAYIAHDQNFPSICTDPIFDVLKDEPRFQLLLSKVKSGG